MSDLIDTTEMYLRTVYELEEEGIVPLRARIAERLGHSGPTVSQTVARMERDGLLHLSGDRHLELTDEGRARATRVMRKHRLAERLLLDVIGLEWQYVHDEACRWEHVISERVERKLLALLDGPADSPYGNPIPGLAEIGGEEHVSGPPAGETGPPASVEGRREPGSMLDAVLRGRGATGTYVVRRLGEVLQTDTALLERFSRLGVRPGAVVDVTVEDDLLVLRVAGGRIEISRAVAAHVTVEVP